MSVHPIEGMLGVSMEKIKEMVDVNTVIGESITTPDGTVIIPVSKVSFGFGSGGSDFPNKRDKDIFGGGTGAGVTIMPVAFLVVAQNNVHLLQLNEANGTPEKILETVPDVIEKITDLFKDKKKNKDKKEKEENEN